MGKRTAGFILYRKINDTIEYLLLHKSKSVFVYHWSPPKGRLETGESSNQAALRELYEETGLTENDVRIVPGFEKELKYELKGKTRERNVTYWIAELKDPQKPIKLSEEHDDFKWFPFDEAFKVAEYDALKEILSDVQAFLTEK